MAQKYARDDEPIPGFRLIKLLGMGGFGEVWKATAPGGIEVALKFIKLDGKKGLKEFRSLALVKLVRHANLVPIMAFWLVDSQGAVLEASPDIEEALIGTVKAPVRETMVVSSRSSQPRPAGLIIAMGLGDLSLTDRLEECRDAGLEAIPLDELMGYMEGAAQAIDYLNSPRHDLGSGPVAIQHCDIKPHNLLIVGGAVQVCDFGLARALTNTRVTTAALSAAYGAPEMWRGQPPQSTTDQYSLAITYYELRTGALPFEDANYAVVMHSHLEGKLELSKLPEAEQKVIAKATRVSPSERYENCRAMVAALREAQRPATLTSQRQAPGASGEGRKGRPVLAGIILLGVLAATFGAAWALFHNQTAPVPPTADPWLPAQFAAAAGAKRINADGRDFYDRIERPLDDITVTFILVPRNIDHPQPQDVATFYIMENKVSTGLFRAFADKQPTGAVNADWTKEPTAESDDLPVMGVQVEDAHRFAQWLGGVHARLPSIQQWNKAAGLYYHQAHSESERLGPYRQDWDPRDRSQIAVGREDVGPLPVGTATHDISFPFGCRDMAGNGLEWTRNMQTGDGTVPLDVPSQPFDMVILRGRSFKWPEPSPLTYEEMRSGNPEAGFHRSGQPDVGFRVVIECAQAAQVEAAQTARASK
jgi:serine/threonine protein kinase